MMLEYTPNLSVGISLTGTTPHSLIIT